VRIGMTLNRGGGLEERVAFADYERAGLQILFVPDAYSFDAASLLGFIAARTERLELASGARRRAVTCSPEIGRGVSQEADRLDTLALWV